MTMKDFGSLISSLRKEKGLSQEEFAAAIGVTKQTISNYERNTRKPTYEMLEAIADEFDVPMSFFLSDEEQRTKLRRIYRTYNLPEEKWHSDLRDKQEDQDLWELRESLRSNPEMRILFDAAKDATSRQLKQAVAILEALKASDGNV